MDKKIKFEEALSELEEIINLLESGEVTLDESIELYEKAVKLVGVCNERLSCAEGKIRILTESADGTVSDAPFACREAGTDDAEA